MVTFTYNRDIPDGPHNPSADQPNMKINTNSTDDILNVDHYSFGESNKDGSHRQVTLTNSAAPGLSVGDGVLYGALVNGNSWPAWQNAAGALPIMSTVPVISANGYVSLPANVLLQWGSSAIGGPISFPITFTSVFAVTTSNGKIVTALTTAGFTATPLGAGQFYWIAIGTK